MKAVHVVAKLQIRGINATTGMMSKVENGWNNPTVEMLMALADIFRCDYNEFFVLMVKNKKLAIWGGRGIIKIRKGVPADGWPLSW